MQNYFKINKNDNVCVALKDLKKGTKVYDFVLKEDINAGHKFAIIDVKKNSKIIKYGYEIGYAIRNINKGEHVHSHNIKTNLSAEIKYKYNPIKDDLKKDNEKVFVNVYKRKNNKYGIRNNLMIVPLVGCINEQAEKIKNNILKSIHKNDVDDVIVAKHPYGCSQLGDDLKTTIKILQSIVKHPNNGGVLVLSLGCENNQLENFKKTLGNYDSSRVKFLVAQDVKDEVKEGTKICLNLVSLMRKDKRVKTSLENITIGLKCGGSDGFSGITANPLVGRISDYFVSHNASTILSEVPEMFGAETILMNRADKKNTYNKIVNLINNFKNYYKSHNQVCYENPSPGNKEGGITTLEDKSLGCVQKSGTSLVKDVLFEGEEIKIKGLNLLNGPGNDMVACTNIACSGAQLILFTTGRGTPFGTFVPTIKISSNTKLFNNKSSWIDFDAGELTKSKTMDELEKSFIKYIIDVINGKIKTKNEINKFQSISIFKDGVTL